MINVIIRDDLYFEINNWIKGRKDELRRGN